MSDKHLILQAITSAMQAAEELSGPDFDDYRALMRAVIAEAQRRLSNATEAQREELQTELAQAERMLDAVPADDRDEFSKWYDAVLDAAQRLADFEIDTLRQGDKA